MIYDEDMTSEDREFCYDLERLLDYVPQIKPMTIDDDGVFKIRIENLFLDYMDSAPFTWIKLRTKEWNSFEVRFDFSKETTPEELAERIVNYYIRHLSLMETFEKP